MMYLPFGLPIELPLVVIVAAWLLYRIIIDDGPPI